MAWAAIFRYRVVCLLVWFLSAIYVNCLRCGKWSRSRASVLSDGNLLLSFTNNIIEKNTSLVGCIKFRPVEEMLGPFTFHSDNNLLSMVHCCVHACETQLGVFEGIPRRQFPRLALSVAVVNSAEEVLYAMDVSS